ncbi:hypothetical protein MMC13_007082 [Lambiella insularis]|nr:hypothetical protein [Lambiella insularis]
MFHIPHLHTKYHTEHEMTSPEIPHRIDGYYEDFDRALLECNHTHWWPPAEVTEMLAWKIDGYKKMIALAVVHNTAMSQQEREKQINKEDKARLRPLEVLLGDLTNVDIALARRDIDYAMKETDEEWEKVTKDLLEHFKNLRGIVARAIKAKSEKSVECDEELPTTVDGDEK